LIDIFVEAETEVIFAIVDPGFSEEDARECEPDESGIAILSEAAPADVAVAANDAGEVNGLIEQFKVVDAEECR
jgi:hypothetical protein